MVGFFLRLAGFPTAPVVIGMVLGAKFESSLRQGLILTEGSFARFFVGHPIAVGLMVMAVLLLCWPLLARLRDRLFPGYAGAA